MPPQLDALFYHRHPRTVRQDGTVSFQGHLFEVPYELTGKRVVLVVDPHQAHVLAVESEAGQPLGRAVPLDMQANAHRRRHRAVRATQEAGQGASSGPTTVELALEQQAARLRLPSTLHSNKEQR